MTLWLSATFVILATSIVALIMMRNYEMNLGVRALKEGNGAEVLYRLGPLARLGGRGAQFQLGCMYALGWGEPRVLKSDKDAIYWFERSAFNAESGVDPAAPAELEVAKSYAAGADGVKVDPIESANGFGLLLLVEANRLRPSCRGKNRVRGKSV